MTDNTQKPNDNVVGVDDNKVMAALSYLGILVLIPLLVKKDDPYVRWHAKQGLVLLIGFIVASVASPWIPMLGNLLFLVLLIVDVIALVQALQGKKWRIPIIGDLADKFNI
jgi:fumarate reductase subunit D